MKKRIFPAILCALGLSSQAAVQAGPSPEGFTQEFLTALQRALPSHTVSVTGPLRLVLKNSQGEESTASLDNAFNEYLQDPTAKLAIIERYVASLAETSQPTEPLRPQQIVPVIKDASWLQDMKRAGGEGMAEQVFEDFNGDLVVVYAEDTPSSTRYFSPDDLQKSGIGRSELRALAVSNLRRLLPPTEIHGGPLVSMLTAGGDYVASLLLIDDLWSSGQLKVDGEIVVAVPTRDVVLFTGSKNDEGVAKLRAMAHKAVSEGSYALTDRLFVYRDGRFQRF